jgi:hypothetical protein
MVAARGRCGSQRTQGARAPQAAVRSDDAARRGRDSTVAVVDARQRGQVVLTVVTIPMVLAGPDAVAAHRSDLSLAVPPPAAEIGTAGCL